MGILIRNSGSFSQDRHRTPFALYWPSKTGGKKPNPPKCRDPEPALIRIFLISSQMGDPEDGAGLELLADEADSGLLGLILTFDWQQRILRLPFPPPHLLSPPPPGMQALCMLWFPASNTWCRKHADRHNATERRQEGVAVPADRQMETQLRDRYYCTSVQNQTGILSYRTGIKRLNLQVKCYCTPVYNQTGQTGILSHKTGLPPDIFP
jgi:hypothetical protein